MKRFIVILLGSVCLISAKGQIKTTYYDCPIQGDSVVNSFMGMINNHGASTNKVIIPEMDISKLLRADNGLDGIEKPFKFGKGIEQNITLDNGNWSEINGGRLWFLSFEADKAHSLNFIFKDFHLPPGGELFIVNHDNTIIYGPVTAQTISNEDYFLTDVIPDSKVTILLYEPSSSQGLSTLTIIRTIYGYRSANNHRNGGLVGSSESCNNDVACFSEYSQETKAVALVLLANGEEWCSGSLVMSTNMTFKPYFLTAFHCLDTNQDGSLSNTEITNAQNWMFKFDYRKTTCEGNNVTTGYSYNGSIFRAAYFPTDFALLEINQALPKDGRHFWLGWNRSGNVPSDGTCIHHPSGDVMKISFDYNQLSSFSWNGTNNHWQVLFDDGVVEHGSSGSPLLDSNNKVVGQLHGNYEYNKYYSYCAQPKGHFGKFSLSWTGGGTNTTRLSNWLDPIGTGQTTMEGLNPSTVSISGPDIPCGTAVYSIPGLPDGYTVTWSWSELIEGFFLLNNTPTTNSCTILNDNKAYINGQLIATIKKNGVTIATRTKYINTGADLLGYCSQDGYSYPGWLYQGMSSYPFVSGDVINVFKGPTITLVSSNFAGANITYSGTTPLDWTHNNNTITFHFKYLRPINPNDPIQNRARSLPSTACLVINGKYPNNCKTFQFTVNGSEPLDPISSNGDSRSESVRLSVQSTGSLYTFTILAPNDISTDIVSEVKDKTFSVEDYLPWRMTISNSLTGKIVYSSDIKDSSLQLETADWSTGIYVIEARIGSEVLRQKFIIAR